MKHRILCRQQQLLLALIGMAYAVMVYIGMAYRVTAYTVAAYVGLAYLDMVCAVALTI